jgi:hypothetical protein
MNSELSQAKPVTTLPITEVVRWTKGIGESRLFLPPIQRSVVWRNSQIINYWDSLLRGYPAGLMMVHRPKKEGAPRARTSDGNTCNFGADDFQLFDGQQRLTAILLGLGEGQLKGRLKLWVDLGSETPADSNLRFVLLISSTGQPFGYQLASPNEKFPLNKRRQKAAEWMARTNSNHFTSDQVFTAAGGSDLIDAKCAVPFKEIMSVLQECDASKAVETLNHRYPNIQTDRLEAFVEALSTALKTPILFQLINPAVIEHEEEYIRFFGRLGQGGTALTNDELTYSIIKHHFPEVHDRLKEITEGPAGRVAGEVNLVLAALRVAKVSAPWNVSGDWHIFGRPQPSFVSRLSELPEVWQEFQDMLPTTPGGRLKDLLESIRKRLVYDKAPNPPNLSGLPVMLLARLPHQLVDVLILMESQPQLPEKSPDFLPAFVLYWLLFVIDSEKAANIIFRRFCIKSVDWQPNPDLNLILHFEEQGIARRLPSLKLINETRDSIRRGTHLLRTWGERFANLDADNVHPTGDALRGLSTNSELIKRALLWLQRDYLETQFHNYDPTMSRDEDLPIDLDHLIPHKKFGDDWRRQKNCLSFPDTKENFQHLRGTVGNSLGNFRWLDAPYNRSRQDGKLEVDEGERDFIKDVPGWNELIEKEKWNENDISAFQRLIDLRTLDVYEELLVSGRLDIFISNPNI